MFSPEDVVIPPAPSSPPPLGREASPVVACPPLGKSPLLRQGCPVLL